MQICCIHYLHHYIHLFKILEISSLSQNVYVVYVKNRKKIIFTNSILTVSKQHTYGE